MTKRCVIDFSGSNNKFRVSKPGIDVDAAAGSDLLFHEDYLFAQPYYNVFVACPFAGNTSGNAIVQTVSVTVPSITSDPIIFIYPVSSVDRNVFPRQKAYGTGSAETGFSSMENWELRTKIVSSTQIDIEFSKDSSSRRSPQGCYLVLMRRPTIA